MGNADFHTIFDELWILVFLRLRLFCCTSFFFFFGRLKILSGTFVASASCYIPPLLFLMEGWKREWD